MTGKTRETHPKALAALLASPMLSRMQCRRIGLSIRVSREARPGACRFLSELFYSLESRNHGDQPIGDDSRSIKLIVNAETVRIELYEPKRWDEKKTTRRITFTIGESAGQRGEQKNWNAKDFESLEKMLPALVRHLEEISAPIRERRLQSERNRAVRLAAERAWAAATNRNKQLLNDLNAWQQERTLSRFIAYVRNTAEESGEDPEGLSAWIQWASLKASKSSPFNDGLASFLDRYDLGTGDLTGE